MQWSLHVGMDFNDTQPFEVTMAAGTIVVSAEIPILNDEINEAEEEFVVVLEVVSNTNNSVELTTNVTVCRIPASDRKFRAQCLVSLSLVQTIQGSLTLTVHHAKTCHC